MIEDATVLYAIFILDIGIFIFSLVMLAIWIVNNWHRWKFFRDKKRREKN